MAIPFNVSLMRKSLPFTPLSGSLVPVAQKNVESEEAEKREVSAKTLQKKKRNQKKIHERRPKNKQKIRENKPTLTRGKWVATFRHKRGAAAVIIVSVLLEDGLPPTPVIVSAASRELTVASSVAWMVASMNPSRSISCQFRSTGSGWS